MVYPEKTILSIACIRIKESNQRQPPSLPLVLICVFLVLDHVFQEFVAFFKNNLSRKVCWADRMEFINGWYILLIVSDFFTIIGSFIKIGIESKVSLSGCVVAKFPWWEIYSCI